HARLIQSENITRRTEMTEIADVQLNDMLALDANAMPWIEMYEGFSIKILRVSPETGHYTMLFRGEAGRVEPRHRHLAGADLYVVPGAVESGPGDIAGAGSWMYEPAGALHTATRYVEDTVGFAVSYGPLVMLDDDDNVLQVLDWRALQSIVDAVAEA